MMRNKIPLVLLIAFGLLHGAVGESEETQPKSTKDDLKPDVVIMEFIGGCGGEVLSIFGVALLDGLIKKDMKYSLPVGLTIGSTVGVWGIGDKFNQKGSFWSAFIGSAIGMLGCYYLTPTHEGLYVMPDIGELLLLLLPSVGGCIGYNLSIGKGGKK